MSISIVTHALQEFLFHSELMEERLKFYFHFLIVFMGIYFKNVL